MDWHMVYTIPLLPMAGCVVALCLVAADDGPDKKDLPHP